MKLGEFAPTRYFPGHAADKKGKTLMSKPKAPRRVAENEALSVGTQIRGSAQKLNLVAALIRGRNAVEDAMNILKLSRRRRWR